MGVAGLWELLKPAAETRSLTELAINEGFLANPQGLRGFRLGIDASIWFFHAEYGKEGENPVLRTLFFRCASLMRTTFLPLFVFDGPKRPDFKRGKKINRTSHKLIPGMKAIIEAFGFEWRMAPAEAEAELAYLNRAGIIDGILSDDVDNFLFGAQTVIRNISNNLSGNRANPILNSQGRDDKNHTRLYRASLVQSHPSVRLTRGGLILIGLLSGGDYAQAGLPGCGIATSHALARSGLGDSLYTAATTMSREELPDFLETWRSELRNELSTDSHRLIGRKLAKLAKQVPDIFPDIDILLSYTCPITSESLGRAAEKNMKLTWGKEPDVGKLAALCEFYFEWGYKEAIIKRFRTLLWHPITLRILRRAVLNLEYTRNEDAQPGMPSTPRKNRRIPESHILNTPSKMIAKQFSSLLLNSPPKRSLESDSEDESEVCLITKIHSSRCHASTDGLLEYRLEIAPGQLVHLAESGIKGTRQAPEKDEWESDEDSSAASDSNDKTKKQATQDPNSSLRVWIPACIVDMAEPKIVEDFKEKEERKLSKKKPKSRKAQGGTKKSVIKQIPTANRRKDGVPDADDSCSESTSVSEAKSKKKVSSSKAPTVAALPRMKLTKSQAVEKTSRKSNSQSLISKLEQRLSPKRVKKHPSSMGYISVSESESDQDHGTQHASSFGQTSTTACLAPFPLSFDAFGRHEIDSSPEISDYPHRSTSPSPNPRQQPKSPPTSEETRSEHTPPHFVTVPLLRPESPSPARPLRRETGPPKPPSSMTVIEISDDSDSDVPAKSLTSLASAKVQPLALAKARAKSKPSSTLEKKPGLKQTSLDYYIHTDTLNLT